MQALAESHNLQLSVWKRTFSHKWTK